MTTELFVNTPHQGITLNGSIATTPAAGTVETWPVTILAVTGAQFPLPAVGTGQLRLTTETAEIVLVTAGVTTVGNQNLTVVRGADGTAPTTHVSGAPLLAKVTATALSSIRGTTLGWYDVRDYGLVADGKTVANGAITASAAILTSASNPFSSGDVGKSITVFGAGAAGAALVTTIASYQSAGQVTLTAAAGTTVSGATADWGADNTSALATLVTTVVTAGGGTVFFPNGIYGFFSAPTTGSNGGTGLINLPARTMNATNSMLTLEFAGETLPGGLSPEVANSPVASSGSILRCSSASTVSGGASANGAFINAGSGAFTFIHLVLRQLTVRLPNATTWHAIDARWASGFTAEHVNADVNISDNSHSQPPAQTYGIAAPYNFNQAQSRLHNCTAEGYGSGFLLCEHADVDALHSQYNNVGYDVAIADHSIRAGRIIAQRCPTVLRSVVPAGQPTVAGTQAADVVIADLDIEDAVPGPWYAAGTHISDSSNYLTGMIRYARVLQATGKVSGLTVTGASNLLLADITTGAMPVASASKLGAIKIGSGLTVSSGVLSTAGGVSADGESKPAWHGYLGMTLSPETAVTSINLSAGGVFIFKIPTDSTYTINAIDVVVIQAGTGATALANCYVGIYDAGGTLHFTSADQSTPWATTGLKSVSTGGYAVTAGSFIYIAMLVGTQSTTNVKHVCASTPSGSTVSNMNLTNATARAGFNGSGASSLPASLVLASTNMNQTTIPLIGVR